MGESSGKRRIRGRKRLWLVCLASFLAIGSEPIPKLMTVGPPPVSLFDPRLSPLRQAAARWEIRQGPDRQVLDQVYLVPDFATFCASLAEWDRGHYFPILIEDAESTPRFLRAFHPARVVRVPPTKTPIRPGQTWANAVRCVRASWRESGSRLPEETFDQDAHLPPTLAATPPGVVLSAPTAPMLAGAIALAAGRFQPLVHLDAAKGYDQTLSFDEFQTFSQSVATAVTRVAPWYAGLGDDCDFLTIAGNYPYRYLDDKGEIEAVDDGLGRGEGSVRWAYAGRILGNEAVSLYQAMCALFLQPTAVTLIDGYDDTHPPWSDFATRGAATQLANSMLVTNHAGPRNGTVAGWFEAFDPANLSGLVWINSHGSPTVFHLQNVEASTTDIPQTVPAAVMMVHSFSAADPTDAATIAGRWLANGAFIYFGSVHEPYLQSFRTPTLVANLIAEHLPLAAALRNTTIEPYGGPWRLEYLGDPLFRLKPLRVGDPRKASGDRHAGESPPTRIAVANLTPPGLVLDISTPAADTSPDAICRAALDAALVVVSKARTGPTDPAFSSVISRLEDLDRESLNPALRTQYDLILADLLFDSHRRRELRARIESIVPADRSPGLSRWLDAIRAGEFAWVLAGDDLTRIIAAWKRLIASDDMAPDTRRILTGRVGLAANDPDRRSEWADALRAEIRVHPTAPGVADLRAELRRVETAIRHDDTLVKPLKRP